MHGHQLVAILDEPGLLARSAQMALRAQVGRVVVFRDALVALEETPWVRPSVLLIPERPIHVSASLIAQNLRNRMGRRRPLLVYVGDPSRCDDQTRASFDVVLEGPLDASQIERLMGRARDCELDRWLRRPVLSVTRETSTGQPHRKAS